MSSDDNLPKVLVVVPCYNEAAYIGECLNSLLSQDYPKDLVDIVVVDNGSTDDSVAIASAFPVRVETKKGGKVGGVRNYGASTMSSDILAFIDADCVASSKWVSSAVEALIKCDSVGAVGGNYLLRENPSWVELGWVLDNFPRSGSVRSLVGGSFITHRNIFDELGGFDELINAGEDTKLSRQILDKGYQLSFIKNCAVVHLGYPSNLKGFVKRQFWHASSYRKSQVGLLRDKTYLAVIVFILLLSMSTVLVFLGQYYYAVISLVLGFGPPLSFTLKRTLSSKSTVGFTHIVYASCLDLAYFSARSVGLLVSLVHDPFKK